MSKFHKHSLTFRLIPKKSKKYFKIDQFNPLTLTLLALRYSSFFFSQTCESFSLSLILLCSSGRWINPTIEAHIIKYPKKLWSLDHTHPQLGLFFCGYPFVVGLAAGFWICCCRCGLWLLVLDSYMGFADSVCGFLLIPLLLFCWVCEFCY